jgi:phosphoglycolate phosphatase
MFRGGVKAVIFDLDGTLQTLEIDFEALRSSLDSFFAGHGVALADGALLEAVESAMGELAQRGLNPGKLSIIGNAASDIMDEAELVSFPKVRTIPGVKAMLHRISKEGYGMSVLSRACRPYVDISLKRIGIPFDAVFSRGDVKRPKPDPEGVVRLLKRMKCGPEECCVVGDHPFDIIAGKRAGTFAAGVLTGSGTRKRLKDAGADIVLERADAGLVKWLGNN